MKMNPVAFAEQLGRTAIENKPSLLLRKLGQYFTPQKEAEMLAGMATLVPVKGSTVFVLDAACGSAILACALALRIAELYPNHILHLTCIDSDPEIKAAATQALDYLVAYLAEMGRTCSYTVVIADFTEYTGREPVHAPSFHYVISNPPFYKLGGDSTEQERHQVMGINNTYQLFLWYSAQVLGPLGEMLVFIPRSFCSGGKFERFRKELLQLLSMLAVRYYSAGAVQFSGSECLAFEQVMVAMQKDELITEQYTFQYSVVDSTGKPEVEKVRLPYSCTANVLPLPKNSEELQLLSEKDVFASACTGYKVQVAEGNILHSECIKHLRSTPEALGARVLWYAGEAGDELQLSEPGSKKPCYLSNHDEFESVVIPAAPLIVLRRYSTGKSGSRLLARLFQPVPEDGLYLAVDKKLLFIRKTTGVFTPQEAEALLQLLNSSKLQTYLYIYYGTINVLPAEIECILNCILYEGRNPFLLM